MVKITGSSLSIGAMYFHSGSGGGDPGGTHPHAQPKPPGKSLWQRFLDWLKSLIK